MGDISFDWDSKKNASNKKKHGVSFEEASDVFYDENARVASDPDHPGDEDRFVILGLSFKLKLLVACYCYRDDDVIRIINARKATKLESKGYKR